MGARDGVTTPLPSRRSTKKKAPATLIPLTASIQPCRKVVVYTPTSRMINIRTTTTHTINTHIRTINSRTSYLAHIHAHVQVVHQVAAARARAPRAVARISRPSCLRKLRAPIPAAVFPSSMPTAEYLTASHLDHHLRRNRCISQIIPARSVYILGRHHQLSMSLHHHPCPLKSSTAHLLARHGVTLTSRM